MDNKILNHSRRSFLVTGAALVAASGTSVTTKNARSADLGDVTVSTLADALNRVGLDPMALAMTPEIKPLTLGSGTILGPAVITKWEAGKGRLTPDDVRTFMFDVLDHAAPQRM